MMRYLLARVLFAHLARMQNPALRTPRDNLSGGP